MAATQSQYRREERRITQGQPVQQNTNWDDHLDGLLTELKDALPAGRGPRSAPAAGSPPLLSADLAVPDDMAGSEDFQERREFTSPDRRTHTVEERSRRTENVDGGSQVVSRKVVRSQSTNRTTERSTVSPEPMFDLSVDGVDTTGRHALMDKNETSTLNNAAPGLHDFNGRLPPLELPAMEVPPPVPGTQSRVSRYEYRSSQRRSVSPAPPRRQPPPTLPKPPAPVSLSLQDASTTTTTTDQPATSAATTINYHIYNYGTEVPPQTDSGMGSMERGGGPTGRLWQEKSLERQVVREGAAPGQLVQQPSPCPAGESIHSRTVTTQQERSASQDRHGRPAYPGHGETMVTRVENSTSQERHGRAAYPAHGETMVTRVENSASQDRHGRAAYPAHGETMVTRVENSASQDRHGRAAYPAHGETMVTRVERSGAAPFPVEMEERTIRDSEQTSVYVPSEPQDATYPDGPRRRDLSSGQVTEVRSAQVVTDLSETASDNGQILTNQSQSQSSAPGVYYPPPGQMNCETKFHSKEKGKEGNAKTHFEASGKYKAKGGSKQKEAKGGKTIPVCLPCCAGAACTIM